MNRPHLPAVPGLILAGALLLAGCGRGGGEEGVAADTLNDAALDGLSREQIAERAQAISPEQAESLGLIDTIVHIPDPTLGEDVVPPAPGPPLQPPPQ